MLRECRRGALFQEAVITALGGPDMLLHRGKTAAVLTAALAPYDWDNPTSSIYLRLLWDANCELPWFDFQTKMKAYPTWNMRNMRTSYFVQRLIGVINLSRHPNSPCQPFQGAEFQLFPGFASAKESRLVLSTSHDVERSAGRRAPVMADEALVDELTLPAAWANPFLIETFRTPVSQLLARLDGVESYPLWDEDILHKHILPRQSPLLTRPLPHELDERKLRQQIKRNNAVFEDNRQLTDLRQSLVKHDFAYDIKTDGAAAALRKMNAERTGAAREDDDEDEPDAGIFAKPMASQESFAGIDNVLRVSLCLFCTPYF